MGSVIVLLNTLCCVAAVLLVWTIVRPDPPVRIEDSFARVLAAAVPIAHRLMGPLAAAPGPDVAPPTEKNPETARQDIGSASAGRRGGRRTETC